jgi:hypothetical protein
LPRDHARQWRRAFDPLILFSNVCDEGQNPAAGFCTFSALLESECSLFSKNQTTPTPRAATIFRSADRDLRNKRSPRHAERSVCRAITRGSGGEQPTHIYSIPTSAVRVKTPPRGFLYLHCLVGHLYLYLIVL